MFVSKRLVKVDGKVRTDMLYLAGCREGVQMGTTKEKCRCLFDT